MNFSRFGGLRGGLRGGTPTVGGRGRESRKLNILGGRKVSVRDVRRLPGRVRLGVRGLSGSYPGAVREPDPTGRVE